MAYIIPVIGTKGLCNTYKGIENEGTYKTSDGTTFEVKNNRLSLQGKLYSGGFRDPDYISAEGHELFTPSLTLNGGLETIVSDGAGEKTTVQLQYIGTIRPEQLPPTTFDDVDMDTVLAAQKGPISVGTYAVLAIVGQKNHMGMPMRPDERCVYVTQCITQKVD